MRRAQARQRRLWFYRVCRDGDGAVRAAQGRSEASEKATIAGQPVGALVRGGGSACAFSILRLKYDCR